MTRRTALTDRTIVRMMTSDDRHEQRARSLMPTPRVVKIRGPLEVVTPICPISSTRQPFWDLPKPRRPIDSAIHPEGRNVAEANIRPFERARLPAVTRQDRRPIVALYRARSLRGSLRAFASRPGRISRNRFTGPASENGHRRCNHSRRVANRRLARARLLRRRYARQRMGIPRCRLGAVR